jgi:hypothetical protein
MEKYAMWKAYREEMQRARDEEMPFFRSHMNEKVASAAMREAKYAERAEHLMRNL